MKNSICLAQYVGFKSVETDNPVVYRVDSGLGMNAYFLEL